MQDYINGLAKILPAGAMVITVDYGLTKERENDHLRHYSSDTISGEMFSSQNLGEIDITYSVDLKMLKDIPLTQFEEELFLLQNQLLLLEEPLGDPKEDFSVPELKEEILLSNVKLKDIMKLNLSSNCFQVSILRRRDACKPQQAKDNKEKMFDFPKSRPSALFKNLREILQLQQKEKYQAKYEQERATNKVLMDLLEFFPKKEHRKQSECEASRVAVEPNVLLEFARGVYAGENKI